MFEENENLSQETVYTCNPRIQETRALMSFRPDLGIYWDFDNNQSNKRGKKETALNRVIVL